MSKRVKRFAPKGVGHVAHGSGDKGGGGLFDIAVDYAVIFDDPDGTRTKCHVLVAVDAADGTLLASKVAPAQSLDASESLRDVALLWSVHGAPCTVWVDRNSQWTSEAVNRVANEFGFELHMVPCSYPSWTGMTERALRAAGTFRTRHRQPWNFDEVAGPTSAPTTKSTA